MRHEVLLDGAGNPMMELPQGAHAFKSKLVVTQRDGLSILMESESASEARDLARIGGELRAGGSKAQLDEKPDKTTLKTKGLRAMLEMTPVGAKMIKRGHRSSGWEVDVQWSNSRIKRKI
ncbi:hypothetical protein HY345_02685 [Candidatus Microgenomates bacterium]|nr:hypothetical protein [Candidatus Microgenomates bacterium]